MTESQIKDLLTDLNALVINGKLMDAFERYYHDDIEMQENDHPSIKGKDFHRSRELQFLNRITEFRSASVEGVAVNGNMSFVIWNYDYTHKDWGVRKYSQVSVQHWQDGKIIKEQFFYGN